MGLVGGFQHAQQAGCPHREAAVHGIGKSQWLAVGADKHVGGGGFGGHFAAIVSQNFGCALVQVQHEGAAPNAGRLGLHQVQHHLYCNGGIDSTTTLSQNVDAGLHGQGVGRRHHVFIGILNRLGGVT